MRLEPREMPSWPPLAWLARCGTKSVELLHGSMVEVGEGWACEGGWAGAFGPGGFDRAAVVAGSGARIRDGEAIFVPPTSTLDRLCSLADGDGRMLVSNSLIAPLAVSGAELPKRRPRTYKAALASISRGLEHRRGAIPTSVGPLRLTYFHNLVWNGRTLELRRKPSIEVALPDFHAYRDFLAGGFASLAANLVDAGRRTPLRFLGTLSSGYDGNACTALAAEVGCADALCFETNTRGHPDSGVPIAEALGITPIVVERDAWRHQPERDFFPEVPFLAVGSGGGLVGFYGAHERLRGAVLVTGFYGDSIWNPAWQHLGPEIVRKDASGLAFCEYRLYAGFINCPATFWAAREVAEVVRIARSEEMAPWMAGAEYQRPVPRRILEDAGVARELFGQRKSGVPRATPHREGEFLRPASQRDYFAWLRRNKAALGAPRTIVSPRLDRLRLRWNDALLRAHAWSRRLPGWGASQAWQRRRQKLRRRTRRPSSMRRHTVWWALERAGEAYVSPPQS